MHSSHTTRKTLAYGLVCVGTLGLFGTALAGSDNMHSDSMSKTSTSEAGQISQDVDKYNKNRGTLQDQDAAKAGTTTGDLNGEMGTSSSSTTQGSNAQSKELSNEVETYNKNRGTIQEDDAAKAGTTTGNLNGQMDQQSSGMAHESSKQNKQLSNEVNEYNENGGTVEDDNAAQQSTGENDTDAE